MDCWGAGLKTFEVTIRSRLGAMVRLVEIRRNDPRDLKAFASLNLAWIAQMHRVEDSDRQMAAHPEVYMQDENSVFAAIVEGEAVGVVALKLDSQGAWELTKMAVDPQVQGRGIGNALMEAVESYAREELGASRIYLLSSTVNAAALRLYKRRGWTVDHEGPHPKYARCDIGMSKSF